MGINRKFFQEKMLEKNVIFISGEIVGDMVAYVRDSIGELICRGSPDVYLVICSSGGSVRAGLDIYDILNLYSGKKTALVSNYAKSMAAVILQVCEHRMATLHTRIMIHHIGSDDVSLDTLRDKDRLTKFIDGMERNQEHLYRILSERTGKDGATIRDECAKEREMSADEAKSFGLIDEIWTKHFPWEVAATLDAKK
jgi:ATP-dependent Clp protease protease subunit